MGYFTSFTAFLAFNDPDFCNKYLRSAAQVWASRFQCWRVK